MDAFLLCEGDQLGEDEGDEPPQELVYFGGGADGGELHGQVQELEHYILRVASQQKRKRQGVARHAATQPWHPDFLSLAPCRFHDFGVAASERYYAQAILPLFDDDREGQWCAFKVEFVLGPTVTHRFVGFSRSLRDDLVRLLIGIISGNSARYRKFGEGDVSGFNDFCVVAQEGHSLLRRQTDLSSFLRVVPLRDETRRAQALPRWDDQAIVPLRREVVDAHEAWFGMRGIRGMTVWDGEQLRVGGGVSLLYLRSLLAPGDARTRYWTVEMVFRNTIQPQLAIGQSFFSIASPRNLTHEYADWFLSDACRSCNWNQLVFGGGIALNSRVPRAWVKGDRFVYFSLFHAIQ